MESKFISELSSPIATGAGGVSFEINAQTLFAILMLSHGRVPGFPCHEIIELRQQTRVEGNNIDDFLLVLKHSNTEVISNVYCQAKRSIDIGNNATFREVISAAYLDSCNKKFNRECDILSLICGSLSKGEQDAISFILQQTHAQGCAQSFFTKITEPRFTNAKVRSTLTLIRDILKERNETIEDEEIYRFLRCFRVWSVDLHYEDGFVLALMHSHISLATKNTTPKVIWSMVYYELAEKNKLAGEFFVDSFSAEILNAFIIPSSATATPLVSIEEALNSMEPSPNSGEDIQTTEQQLAKRITAHRCINDAFLAILVGGWNDISEKDKLFISNLVNEEYDTWKARLKILYSDFPDIFTFKNNEWQITQKQDLLHKLDRFFFDDILDRFQRESITCLSEHDPEFEFPPEARYYQGQRSVGNYSLKLRSNISETLAILGNMPSSPNYSSDKLRRTADTVVRTVLDSGDYKIWGSLNKNIEYLAEASPDIFLAAVERVFCIDITPLQKLYADEESDNSLFHRNYSTGLFWALEKLAWTDQYFMRAMDVLINLTKCDRSKKWGNTPLNTLIDILLPWHPQTLASIEKRKNVIPPLVADVPESAWKLILGLLPKSHSTTSGTVKPQFIQNIPEDFPPPVSKKDYWELTNYYFEQALKLAPNDIVKLCELVEFIDDVPVKYTEEILLLVSDENILKRTEEEKFPLWEKLLYLSKKHRRFPDAKWVLPEQSITRIEDVVKSLEPPKASLAYIPYFSYRVHDIMPYKTGDEESYKETEKLILQIQEDATKKIWSEEQTTGLIEFAKKRDTPSAVGVATAKWFSIDQSKELLEMCLSSSDQQTILFINGFIWVKYCSEGERWVTKLDITCWSDYQKTVFLCAIPISLSILSLVNDWLPKTSNLYWEKIDTYSAPNECFYLVIDNLLRVGRPWKAIELLGQKKYSDDFPFDANIAKSALFAQEKIKEIPNQMTGHYLLEILHLIQNTDQLNDDEKAIIEWNFLSVLDKSSDEDEKRVPRFLYKKLSADPNFFCEIIGYAYRSRKEKDSPKKLSEKQEQLAKNAWKLLWHWHRIPGMKDDGTFDFTIFKLWFDEVVAKTSDSGHLEVALVTIGEALFYSPAEEDNTLWINRQMASLLNKIEYEKLRNGYSTECTNSRGAFWVDPTGAPELEFAQQYEDKATAVDNLGFSRLASTLRSVAQSYRLQAKSHQERTLEN